MMVCKDPGPAAADTFVFKHNGRVVKTVRITPAPTAATGVGVCVGTLYSARPNFTAWASATLASGFSEVYVYYGELQRAASASFALM